VSQLPTEMIIDQMVESATRNGTDRDKHIFREMLRALVRQAKAEKLFEIRMDVAKAVGKSPV
jgi:hypothetical protein